MNSSAFDSLGNGPPFVAASFHCKSGISFRRLFDAISFEEIVSMYNPLHEADEEKFFEIVVRRLVASSSPTNLRTMREAYGYTQLGLARASGVSLRSIQMYEQRNKDINKASAMSLLMLSRALHCEMEELMEI